MYQLQLESLQEYTRQIETIYDEIRSFRHDYVNIIRSLELGINTRDMDSVREVFERTIRPSGERLEEVDFSLAKLKNVGLSEIKSLLISKVMLAQSKEIDIKIEVYSRFNKCYISILDYYRIVAILLDNAIEAAIYSRKKCMWITFIHEEGELVCIISNSTREESLNIKSLSKKNNSTKGKNKGIGLYGI